MPTKIPCSCEPVNHKYTDSKKEIVAANKIEAFAIRILELMSFYSFRDPFPK